MRNAVLAGALLLATPAAAQTPDYVEVGARMEQAAKVANSVGSCSHYGYQTDGKPNVDAFVGENIAFAIRNGVDKDAAAQLLDKSLIREREAQEYLGEHQWDGAVSKQDFLAKVGEYLAFWSTRCAMLADDEYGSRYIKRAPAQEAVERSYIAKQKADVAAAWEESEREAKNKELELLAKETPGPTPAL